MRCRLLELRFVKIRLISIEVNRKKINFEQLFKIYGGFVLIKSLSRILWRSYVWAVGFQAFQPPVITVTHINLWINAIWELHDTT